MPRDVISKHGLKFRFRISGHTFIISVGEERLGLVDLPWEILSLISIIAQVIIEMGAFWLIQKCVISRHNILTRGDYGRNVNLQRGCLAFCQCFRGSDERDSKKKRAIAKSTKDAIELGGTLFKKKIWFFFCLFNWVNLPNSFLILIRVITTTVPQYAQCFLYLYNRIRKYLNNYTNKIIRPRLSERCWIIHSATSLRLFNNVDFAFGE